ncbi:Transcriptional regulatory protein BtsR [Burkholderiales bacterium]|nr:MAG: response regulator transcription factor [Burkholderiales bacterium]CAG0973997.1 Transcriptional regulatory protein BtsR [Burkholderiales bacterium]
MTVLRALVADDERLMRDQLRAALGRVWPEIEIVAEAKNGEEGLRLIRELHPDVSFLDIRMPGLSGIELARQVCAETRVVFVTAYDEYAVAAFDEGAVDYLLKPVEDERLARCRRRLEAREAQPLANMQGLIEKLATRLAPQARQYLEWIQATRGNLLRMIATDEVLFFRAEDKYTRVVTRDGESLIRKPIKELIEELDPARFWQIHRAILVNTKAISGITRDLQGRQRVLVQGSDEKLEVSRTFSHLFKQM